MVYVQLLFDECSNTVYLLQLHVLFVCLLISYDKINRISVTHFASTGVPSDAPVNSIVDGVS